MAGQKLKILPGPAAYYVDRWRLSGTLEIGGAFLRRYPVGIGPERKTPSGIFSIHDKQANPEWYFNGSRIPFGDPRNILGTRWMGFEDPADYGIHGTTKPETVGTPSSNGCVRMRNADVEELFDMVPRGTSVTVQ